MYPRYIVGSENCSSGGYIITEVNFPCLCLSCFFSEKGTFFLGRQIRPPPWWVTLFRGEWGVRLPIPLLYLTLPYPTLPPVTTAPFVPQPTLLYLYPYHQFYKPPSPVRPAAGRVPAARPPGCPPAGGRGPAGRGGGPAAASIYGGRAWGAGKLKRMICTPAPFPYILCRLINLLSPAIYDQFK